MSRSTTTPVGAPTQPLRVALALLAVDRRVTAIEIEITTTLLRGLPAPLLAGPHGATLQRHLRAYAAAQSVATWLAEEGWPWPEDRAWARRRAERAARRLAYGFTRALVGHTESDGDPEPA
jgi:hypothetical protein